MADVIETVNAEELGFTKDDLDGIVGLKNKALLLNYKRKSLMWQIHKMNRKIHKVQNPLLNHKANLQNLMGI